MARVWYETTAIPVQVEVPIDLRRGVRPGVGPELGQRLGRWSNCGPTPGECCVLEEGHIEDNVLLGSL